MDDDIKIVTIKSKSSTVAPKRITSLNVPSSRKRRQPDNKILIDHYEVNPQLLPYLHGSWVNYIDNISKIAFPGGFIEECDYSTSIRYVKLRSPQTNEETLYDISKNTFYIKNTNKNFINVKDLYEKMKKYKFLLDKFDLNK